MLVREIETQRESRNSFQNVHLSSRVDQPLLLWRDAGLFLDFDFDIFDLFIETDGGDVR